MLSASPWRFVSIYVPFPTATNHTTPLSLSGRYSLTLVDSGRTLACVFVGTILEELTAAGYNWCREPTARCCVPLESGPVCHGHITVSPSGRALCNPRASHMAFPQRFPSPGSKFPGSLVPPHTHPRTRYTTKMSKQRGTSTCVPTGRFPKKKGRPKAQLLAPWVMKGCRVTGRRGRSWRCPPQSPRPLIYAPPSGSPGLPAEGGR